MARCGTGEVYALDHGSNSSPTWRACLRLPALMRFQFFPQSSVRPPWLTKNGPCFTNTAPPALRMTK